MRAAIRSLTLLASLAVFAALPAAAGAQHRFIGHLDVGAAPSGGGHYTNTGGLVGRAGGGIRMGPEVDFEVNASAFGKLNSTACALTASQCPSEFPSVRAVVFSMGIPLSSPYDEHRATLTVGGGPFFVSGGKRVQAFTAFGTEFGGDIIAIRRRRSSLTLGGHVQVIPLTPSGLTWLAPLTVGVRF